ncbi:MAG: prolyl oligopeptidase family serine peptidase, partial [Dokdonella sp.]
IDIPTNWNRELVVFYHGYEAEPKRFSKDEALSPMFDPLLDRGYAVLQSGYSVGGWAVEQGYADTEMLRRKFISDHGKPKRSFVMGMSMGGTLTVMTIEKRPQIYAGALSLCGVLKDTHSYLHATFALRAAFDHYFPDVLGPLVPVPEDFVPTTQVTQRVLSALRGNVTAKNALLKYVGVGNLEDLAAVLTIKTYQFKELQHRAGGNPFDNSELIYSGSGDDDALNDGVKRYRAETKARAYMLRWYSPSGDLKRPMLALHDVGDPLVVASTAFEYATLVQLNDNGANFTQQYVKRSGHCVFDPSEIANAFDQLVNWIDTGRKPPSGALPELVAE